MPPQKGETRSQTQIRIQWKKLDKMILDYYDKVGLKKEKYLEALVFKQKMEDDIRTNMPGARLEIGGSLYNGFGTQDSDLDLCFRLEDDSRPKGFDELKTMTDLSEILTGMGLNNSLIKTKFLLVKCDNNNSLNRSIDISCYNTLPLCNMKLLAKYCEWEPKRLPVLGVWVKKWAKECSIGDASEGTLSSYAWMIILIYYLQNCSPPVLPRLQEDFRTNDTVAIPHLKCDVYFHEAVHKNWSSNTQSVAGLFLGFLKYIGSFDFEKLVIQIRRKAELTKTEKNWRAQMCVEDPFLLSHNLAQRRGNLVINYIRKTARNTQKALKMAEEFEMEKILESCKLGYDGPRKKCVLCGKVICMEECENRMKMNTVLRAQREERRRLIKALQGKGKCTLCGSKSYCQDGCDNRFKRHPDWEERTAKHSSRKEQKEKSKCTLCGSKGVCKDGCENRFERHPNWTSKEERIEKQKYHIQQKELAKQENIEKHLLAEENKIMDLFANLRLAENNLGPQSSNQKISLKTLSSNSKPVPPPLMESLLPSRLPKERKPSQNKAVIEGTKAPNATKAKNRFNGNRTFYNSKLSNTVPSL